MFADKFLAHFLRKNFTVTKIYYTFGFENFLFMDTTIIAVSNHKGGVGKTTSVVNIGAGLALIGYKVLLIDMDPQANMTQSFGINKAKVSVYDILKGEAEAETVEVFENLEIIPSTLDLSGAEMELINEAGREYILTEAISGISQKYDYVFIDCPPSLGLLTINALTAANEVYIPLQAHYLAIKGLTKIIEVIGKVKKRLNKKIEITGVFVTQYDKRKVLHRDVVDTIYTYFQEKLFDTKIRENIALAEAPSQGMDIFHYAPECRGAEDYKKLCKEIIERHLDGEEEEGEEVKENGEENV
jgi:chromosome partitioning protein